MRHPDWFFVSIAGLAALGLALVGDEVPPKVVLFVLGVLALIVGIVFMG